MGQNFGECSGYIGSDVYNAELYYNYFCLNVSVPAVVFHRKFQNTDNFALNYWFF